MKNIIIIGNGAAGNSAAETIRRQNMDVPIVMIAREELPIYSACALPDCLSGWVNRNQLFIKQMQDYKRIGIITKFGYEISHIDIKQRLILTDKETIAFDRLILATGSRAIIPPVPGSNMAGNFVVKTISDIDQIMAYKPHQVLVVGSGNIGVEVAEALHMRGCQVTMVEVMDHILPRIFDKEPARRLSQMLLDHGITVLTREKVIGVSGGGRVEGATTDQRAINCDTIIWAAGVRQNVEIAQTAGVRIGKLGGIQVDSHMQTNLEGIYACGDCIESIDMLTGKPTLSLLWPNAKRQGEVAALNCLGQEVDYEGAVSMVVEDICGMTAISMGMTSAALDPQDTTILEGQTPNEYWRVLVQDDLIMGMQTIGITSGLGAVMTLMKKRTTLREFKQTVSDDNLIRKTAWYLPACRFLEV